MAILYEEEHGLLYEIQNGERVLVRSTNSNSQAYLRFTNKTGRPVDVWWRNFGGDKHHYVCLSAGGTYDVNTYITHPWEFTDVVTKERYCINNNSVYRPPTELGGMQYRTNWNITIPVRSLRHTCMLAIAHKLDSADKVKSFELPSVLESELQKVVNVINGEVVVDMDRP